MAARQGDLEAAINHGERDLSAPRKSLPSLLMVSRDLTRVLNDQYPSEPQTQAYLDQIHALSALTGTVPANSRSALLRSRESRVPRPPRQPRAAWPHLDPSQISLT